MSVDGVLLARAFVLILERMRSALVTAIALCVASVIAAPLLGWLGRGGAGEPLVSAAVAALCCAILIVARRVRLPLELTLVLVLPFTMAWGLGFGLGLFERVFRFDLIVHAVTGACLGVLGAAWALALPLRAWRRCAALVCGVALAATLGALWEVAELAVDVLFGLNTLVGARNTAYDLAADIAGAAVGSAFVIVAARRAPVSDRERLRRPFLRLQPAR